MTAYHVGIDLHKTVAQICVLDAQGEVLQERRVQLPDREAGDALIAWLAGLGPDGRFAVEALGCNRWFVNACREIGLDVLIVDASKLDLRKLGKKTDRRDAREIARRLWIGDLDRFARTYFPTEVEYGHRKLLRVRHVQLKRRTSTVTQIRGLLNAYLLRPRGSQMWTWKCIAWLREQRLATEELDFALQILVDDLENIQRQILALNKRIRQVAEGIADTAWMTEDLPSVAAHTALVLRAELGDARRFENARAVASYAGVVPRVAASADKSHHGRMTKRGNPELRWILSQWAVRLLAFNPEVKTWAAPKLRRMHKNKVRMELARRLLIGVWVVFSRGEVFSLPRCLGRAA